MTIKEQVKDLWRLCFNDNDDFIDLYFRHRYSNKVNVTIQSGDAIISSLQMIPYNMMYCGYEIETSYISGACTHPDYRDRGVMRELLSQAFAQMTRKGNIVSTLIPGEPWLFGYYRKMGYAPVFNYSETLLNASEFQESDSIEIKSSQEFDKATFDYLDQKMHKRPCVILHGENDYRIILQDLVLSGGRLYTAYQNGKITGLATVVPREDFLQVTELLSDDERARNTLLKKSSADYKAHQISIITPPQQDGNIRPLGMARIIYAKAILQLYAAANPKEELNIELTDKHLSINNGYYYLMNGKCMTTKKKLPGSHIQMNISELTERVFSPYRPYMSLMIN